jgi:hypothetical protein
MTLLRSVLTLVLIAAPLAAQDARAALLGVRVDGDRNKLLLEIPTAKLDRDLLHQSVLATGLGVSAVGLDRGQTGGSTVIRLQRQGRRVLMVANNLGVRALSGGAAAERAANESFPRSVLASFPIESDTGGVLTVDATSFFLTDTYGVIESLRRSQQGTPRVDAARSWFDGARTKAFATNVEIHAVLTLAVDNAGFALRRTASDASSPVFEIHHSIVELPPLDGFRPRASDPRAGLFGVGFWDFSQGFDGTYRDGYASRWRLVPRDVAAYRRGQLSEPVNPIVYYLDPAIPEPYRAAFREGGMWWSTVFQAAGFRNAFQVRDLPADADPMDARYNLIYWVHRNGPGPSVGPSFTDPRTGEILRTVVRMDSWRSLIDFNIYMGLVPTAGQRGLNVTAEDFTMARRRQHTAHEIGHTLGLAHNYIASSQGRSSVMDYPVPIVTANAQNQLDLSRAYAPMAGAWDSLAIRYGYTWYPDAAAEEAGLRTIINDGIRRNVRFVGDQHAGAEGSIPEATRWDEGATLFDAVERTVAVRRIAMNAFDERAIMPGEPMYLLNMRFAHVYLHHRYSLEGLIKYVGGMDFRYTMRGDGQTPTAITPAADQRRALAMALDALEPAQLAVPERVLALIPPAPPGGDQSLEWIGLAGTALDHLALAGGLATEVVEGLLQRERTERVALFHARNQQNPSLDEVVRTVVTRTWGAAPAATAGDRALRRTVQRAVLNTLLDRAGDRQASPEVRAVMALHLEELAQQLSTSGGGADAEDRAHRRQAARDIARFLDGSDDPATRSRFTVIPLPWP